MSRVIRQTQDNQAMDPNTQIAIASINSFQSTSKTRKELCDLVSTSITAAATAAVTMPAVSVCPSSRRQLRNNLLSPDLSSSPDAGQWIEQVASQVGNTRGRNIHPKYMKANPDCIPPSMIRIFIIMVTS
ncbi:hypothetical protein PoB_004983600 [Plakobranchus ocellatus]|uniref:Uncharacterized protein n=1 Tax=Plakobranchus ocellatus TaxID=259542 RepID=A0AAV4BS92_9GAST|nr:hypothetical protein PoB_004983600 [Plakobranchus ocellatus]